MSRFQKILLEDLQVARKNWYDCRQSSSSIARQRVCTYAKGGYSHGLAIF